MRRIRSEFWLYSGFAVSTSLAAISVSSPAAAAPSDIETRRSLVVTEQPILARFPFQRVLDQLVTQSGVQNLTSLSLFHQWWDTQNPGGGPCDSEPPIGPGVNSYPYQCRPAASQQEGAEANSDPFIDAGTNPGEYIPIGLFNRFDLAPANGANCGEHRIVYARRSGLASIFTRNLIIFEATMPNPHLEQGLKGCDKIVKFWANLSKEDDIEVRAEELEEFYFAGLANLPPVVEISHYGDNPTGVGQIRTNQFLQSGVAVRAWNLREFKLLRTCEGGSCLNMQILPVTDKSNPFGPLFSPSGTHPRKPDFETAFLGQVEALAAGTLAGIDMKIDDPFNSGQSLAVVGGETDYVAQFAGPSTFRDQLDHAAEAYALVADDIIKRARALSCAGCHQLSANSLPGQDAPDTNLGNDLFWPPSLGFTHVTERDTELDANGVTRFMISPALIDVFLPARKQVMDNFLDDKPFNTRRPDDPIGGRRVH